MKKLLIALLSFLTVGITNTAILEQNSSALYQENGITWWTVEELMDFSAQIDAETKALCGNDMGCRQEYYFNNLEGDNPKYRALDRFYQTQFRITSINPEQETIEVLFLDQNPMLRTMGIDEHYPLDYIFMAWFYEHNPNITNYYYAYPDEEQFPDDLHIIYSNGEYPGGTFPSNQKFELPINQTGLRDNPLDRIYLATFGEQYNSMGSIDYASCLGDPVYTPGTTCELMISADNGEQFFPVKAPLLQSSNDVSDTEEEPKEYIGEANNRERYGSVAEQTATVSKDSKVTAAPSIKAPETGMATKQMESTSFWWLGLVIAPSFLALIWLFLPISTKTPKIKKKSVDKNKNLR